MRLQTVCPCCQCQAMSLWQKLSLTSYTSRRCASCNATLGIEQIGWGWFMVGWVPFSLSGLVPLPLKLVLGSLGIGLMLFPYLFLIPLVEKAQEENQPAAPTWLAPWLLFLVIGMVSTDWINWIPEQSTRLLALLASVVCSTPIIHLAWRRVPKADEKMLAFAAGSLLVVAMHYFALSVLPAALITLIGGHPATAGAAIVRSSHTNKLTHCGNKIDIRFYGEADKHELCVSENLSKAVRAGDRLTLEISQTAFGRLIVGIRSTPQP